MNKISRLILLAAALGTIAPAARASALSDFWADVKAQSDLKLGDNIQPAVFYNVKHGVAAKERMNEGVLTTLYTYRQLDLNFGGLKGLNVGTPFVPVASVNLRLDKYLAKGLAWVPPLLGESANADFFKRLKVGPYFAYDFRDRSKSYGFDVAVFFGALPAAN